MSHKKLFIPGPVEVHPDVLAAMSTPQISHRGKECSELQKRITEKMRNIVFSQNPIIISTSSGSGMMEMAVRCCTAKRAIVFSIGAFGNRWHEIAEGNGVPADKHEVQWGTGITPEMVDAYLSTGKYDCLTITHNETSTGVENNLSRFVDIFKKYPDVVVCVDAVSSLGGVKIEIDKLGLDVVVSSSQKAFGLPPGLSFGIVSPKAEERARTVKNRGYYFDMLVLLKFIKEKDFQYPSTPSLAHMFALDLQLDRIMKEGVENRFKRHQELAKMVRTWAKKNFKLFAQEDVASATVTAIENTRGISVKDLNAELGKRFIEISNGYGGLKEKTFRIAHMADMQKKDIQEVLDAIDDILKLR
ncbi:MAG: alanine--glyoxylate aminotransferase family protein [Spirochaetaceae bacterium]|nr:MAG: alanine--glyoxylate aminotransferase family protein [Spirochaetaceae bacterium]